MCIYIFQVKLLTVFPLPPSESCPTDQRAALKMRILVNYVSAGANVLNSVVESFTISLALLRSICDTRYLFNVRIIIIIVKFFNFFIF